MFGPNTIGRGRGQSTSDRKRRARRWNLRSRTNSLAEALAQNQNCSFSTKMTLRSFAMLQMLQFGRNTIFRARGHSTGDRRRRARRWNLCSRANSLAEALAQNQNCTLSTKMMRFLLFRVYGQQCMVFDGLGFTVQK